MDQVTKREVSGTTAILIAGVCFAFMHAGVKFLSHIPSSEIVFFRAAVTLVIGFISIRLAGLNPFGNNKPLLILRGLSGTIALVLYFRSLQAMPLATAVTIQYLSPIFTIILAAFLLKERTRPLQWLFFLISFSGVILIRGFDARVSTQDLMIGVTAAFASGFAYNMVRKLRDYDHPLVVVFYFPLITIPLISPYVITHWVQPHGWDWIILLLIGVFTQIAQVFMTIAYQKEAASNISNYNYLNVVYALLLGFLIFDETLGLVSLIGIGLIIGSSALSSIVKNRR